MAWQRPSIRIGPFQSPVARPNAPANWEIGGTLPDPRQDEGILGTGARAAEGVLKYIARPLAESFVPGLRTERLAREAAKGIAGDSGVVEQGAKELLKLYGEEETPRGVVKLPEGENEVAAPGTTAAPAKPGAITSAPEAPGTSTNTDRRDAVLAELRKNVTFMPRGEANVLGRGTLDQEVTMPRPGKIMKFEGGQNYGGGTIRKSVYEPSTLPGWHQGMQSGDYGVITPGGSLQDYIDAKYGPVESFDPDKARIEGAMRRQAVSEAEANAAEAEKIAGLQGGREEYEQRQFGAKTAAVMNQYKQLMEQAQKENQGRMAQITAMPENTPEEKKAKASAMAQEDERMQAYGQQVMAVLLSMSGQKLPGQAYQFYPRY